MILYASSCLACAKKPLWKKLRQIAAQNKTTIQVRRVDRVKQHREEADIYYGMEVPFVVINDKPVRVSDL